MYKLGRIILSLILIGGGLSITAFSATLLIQLSDWIMIALAVAFFFIGIMIAMSGLSIARGAKISEVLSDLFRIIGR